MSDRGSMVQRVTLALLCSLSFAQAEDWPQFRGPTGQGLAQAQGLPVEWSQEKNVAWRTPLTGSGWSSPVVVKGRVYLTAAVSKQDEGGVPHALTLLCFNAATGEMIWQNQLFEETPDTAKIHPKNSHASPTPIVDQDLIYVHFGHEGTACVNIAGETVWKTQEHKYIPVHGNGSSPVLVDGLLIFTADGAIDPAVVALDATSGAIRWKYARPNNPPKKFAFCTPLVIELDGRKQVIAPGAGSVAALAPETGEELWRVDYGDGYSVVPRPIFGHGLLFLGSGYDSPEVYAIRPDGSGNVTETHVAWRMKRGAPNTPSMLLIGEELYFVSDGGVATCVDALTGEPHWKERIGGGMSASPVFADGKIYFVDESGKGTVVNPGKTFEKLGTNDLKERSLASYAVAENAFFIRTDKALYRIQNIEPPATTSSTDTSPGPTSP